MKKFLTWFRNVSITKKIYFTIGTMALLITLELVSLMFSLSTLSSVRALVSAEGLWSKSQKNAVISLKQYTLTKDEKDYQEYLTYFKIPLGDNIARVELLKKEPNDSVVNKGFIAGGNHPDDVQGMTNLLKRFHSVSYLNKAISIWTTGDSLIFAMHEYSQEIHQIIQQGDVNQNEQEMKNALWNVNRLNRKLTILENQFSHTLGEGARWLENLISNILLIVALTVEISGLILSFVVTRNIKKDINSIVKVSEKVANGNFEVRAKVNSKDEIGVLASSFNKMIRDLAQNAHKLNSTQETLKQSEAEIEKNKIYLENNQKRIDEIMEMLLKLTIMDFSKEIEMSDQGDVIDAIAMGLNIISAEMQEHLNEINDYTSKIESIFENAPDVMLIMDTKGKILMSNRQTEKVFGYEKDELNGEHFSQLIPKFQDSVLSPTNLEEIKTDFSDNNEFIGRRKNNENFPIEMNVNFFEMQKGVFVTTAIRDISEKKRSEEARINAENEIKVAKESLRFKQQFLSNMSHEIRTPMTAIIGFTKIILEKDLLPAQREYLSAIKSSGDALLSLINDILDIAKVDAGKMEFVNEPFNVKELLHSIILLFKTKAEEKELQLTELTDNRIPSFLLGDAVRLNQILNNLLSNSIKFTEEGRVSLEVSILEETQEQITLRFAVMDTGIGIDHRKLGTIFQNFEQANHKTSKLYGGTGLGLAIVKQLVEAQGGAVEVQSKIGVGSIFSFTLGFEKTEKQEEENSVFVLDDDIKNLRVLVAEDNPVNKILIKYILTDFGFESEMAENGSIAIEMLKQKQYDIILMDLQMPVMSGIEATLYIRNEMNSSIPIIALTADLISEDLKNCFSAGMNDYTTKPIDDKLLYRKMIQIIRNQREK